MNWLMKVANNNITFSPEETKLINFLKSAANEHPLKPTLRLVGGWVRDKLLNVPSKDYDVTVDKITGEQFGQYLLDYDQRHNTHAVGRMTTTEERPEQIKQLAVSFVSVFGNPVEILSLRKEEYDPGNRNPRVTSGTPEEDAYRRDLTINSLFYNINTNQIEDFTGKGLNDIKTLTLQTPLDPIKTFTDDPLRVLRVLRFNARYTNSHIEPNVLEAMKNDNIQSLIANRLIDPQSQSGIVAERTADELRKIMKSKHPSKAIRIMYEVGLLNKIMQLPESFNPMNMDQRNKHHTMSVIDHTLSVMEHLNEEAIRRGLSDDQRMKLNFAALVHDVGKLDPKTHKQKIDPVTKQPTGEYGYSGNPDDPEKLSHEESSGKQWMLFANSLKLSADEIKDIHNIIVNHMAPHAHVEDKVPDKTLRKYKRENPDWELHYIHAIGDLLSKGHHVDPKELQLYNEYMQRIGEMPTTPQPGKGHGVKEDALLRGDEIMNLAGPSYDPKTGYVTLLKQRIQDKRDENPNFSKQDAINLVNQIIQSGELVNYKKPNKLSNWLTNLTK